MNKETEQNKDKKELKILGMTALITTIIAVGLRILDNNGLIPEYLYLDDAKFTHILLLWIVLNLPYKKSK